MTMRSTASVLNMRAPNLSAGSVKGARLIFSMPPATMTSASPVMMAWAPLTMARRPDAQTLLTVKAVVSFGTPPYMAACLPVFCPCPAWSTFPMITSSMATSFKELSKS